MTETATSFKNVKNKTNVIDPHAPVDGKVQVIRRDWSEIANSAGGIYSNISDMSKWIILQMNDGKYGDGPEKKIFSEDVFGVQLPGVNGLFEVLDNHAPLISALQAGRIKVLKSKTSQLANFEIKSGFVEVMANNVTVLVEGAAEAIDR